MRPQQSGKSLVRYFVRKPREREFFVNEMRPLAKKYHEYLHFTTTDANGYPHAAEMVGLKPGTTGLSVQNPSNGDIFPYRGKEKITATVVENFLVDIIQGRVQPWRPGVGGDGGHDEL